MTEPETKGLEKSESTQNANDTLDRKDSTASGETALSFEEEPTIEVEGVETEVETLVSRDGVELWSKTWKPAPGLPSIGTITFVQGIGENCSRFEDTFIQFVREGFTVHTIEHRGHGNSRKPKKIPHLDDFLCDLYLLLHKCDTNLPHFLYGYSLGALFVLYYVLKYCNTTSSKPNNQRVDGIILSSPVFKPPVMSSPLRKSFDSLVAKVAPKSRTSTGIKEKHMMRQPSDSTQPPRPNATRTYTPVSVVVHLGDEGSKLKHYLPDIKLPLLTILGEKDKFVKVDKTRHLFDLIGSEDKEFITFEEVFHDIHHDVDKEQVMKTIVDWIKKHMKSPTTSTDATTTTTTTNTSNNNNTSNSEQNPSKVIETSTEKQENSSENSKEENGPVEKSVSNDSKAEASTTSPATPSENSQSSPIITSPTPSTTATTVPGKRTVADFQMEKTLGNGAFGEVKLATEIKTGKQFAVKMLDKKHIIDSGKKKYVQTERNIFNKLSHPNIVKLFFTFQDPKTLYYVLELCPNGDLSSHLKRVGRFDVDSARFYVAEIINALEHMHSKGIIHRDLKPDNVLLDPSFHVKLTDFGTSKELTESFIATPPVVRAELNNNNNANGEGDKPVVETSPVIIREIPVTGEEPAAAVETPDSVPVVVRERAESFCGTEEYVSPELLGDDPHCVPSSDLWALGCILYHLLAGTPPFKGQTTWQTFQLIQQGVVQFPDNWATDPVLAHAQDLISKILVADPSKRLGADTEGGYSALKSHPFFGPIDFSAVSSQTPPPIQPPSS